MKLSKVTTLGVLIGAVLFSGCATVPMEPKENSIRAKLFNHPSEGNAGLYVFRDSTFGARLKKDIWIDGKCLGESAPKVFFYEEVKGNEDHTLSTQSEFSPNDFQIKIESGKNYFIRQYIKMGVFFGGANLELIEEAEGKKIVSELEMATKGLCSK